MDKYFVESVLTECDKYIDADSKLKSRQRVNQLEEIRCARALSRKEVGSKDYAAEDRGIHLKCVLVGDGCIGKSSLTHAFVFGQFSSQYIPTVYDEYIVNKMVSSDRNEEGSSSCARVRENLFKIPLLIGDTGGQTQLDRLRPLCYQNTDVILICFSVVVPSSFSSVTNKWVRELKRHTTTKSKQLALLLIGTQSDLRSNWNVLLNLSKQGLRPIAETEALRLAKKIGAMTYIECSAFTMKNVGEVFDKTLKFHRVMETNFNLKKVKFVGFCQPIGSEILTHITTESCVVDIEVDDDPQQSKSLGVAKERSLDTNSYKAAVTPCSNSKNKIKNVNNRCFLRTRYSIGPSMRLRTKSSKLKRLILFKCLFRQSNHGFHIDYTE